MRSTNTPSAGTPSDLLATFERLTHDAPRRDRSRPWWPFAVIVALVLLMTGLFTALLLEDLASRENALRRDVDSAAQQLAARLAAVKETATATALEAGTGVIGPARLNAVMRELMAAKAEVRGAVSFDAQDAPVWGPVSPTISAPMADIADATLARTLQRARTSAVPWFELDEEQAATLLLTVPISVEQRYAGAVTVLISLPDLLRESVQPDIAARYQLGLMWRERLLAGAVAEAAYRTSPSMLPAEVQLAGSAVEPPSALPGGNLLWIATALALAVAGALFVLARSTARLVQTDRALLTEASLRRAMENSLATGLRVLDADGTIRYVNRAFCRMTGWSDTDLIGSRPPFVYWPVEARAENQDKLSRLLAGAAPPDGFEVVIQRRDGSRFDARMYVSPLQDDSGRQIGWLTSMTDVTEPNRIRNALAEAHRRFLTVLESLEAAVSVVADELDDVHDGAAPPLFTNRSYRELFGDDAGAHRRLAQALMQTQAEPHAAGGEVADAVTQRWFDARVRPIRWPGETDAAERGATLLIAADITLRKGTEDIVREQQEKVQFTARLMTLGEMASSLAHELNQPLTAIANYCEGTLARLAAGRMSEAELAAALEKTAAQAQRAGQIIRRIREFVKRSEPRRRATPVQRIIDDAVGFAQIDAARKGVSIRVTIEPALPPLDADPLLIEQVLLNLLKNGIDASPAACGAVVELKAAPHDDFAQFAQFDVIDRGSGISEAQAARLFQPFFSTKPEGMGMGLAICRSIVEFHGGRLTLQANAQGAGTTARFTLPLASPESANEAAQFASNPTLSAESSAK
jgi:hypothetical protein